jgi:hypothetical protein
MAEDKAPQSSSSSQQPGASQSSSPNGSTPIHAGGLPWFWINLLGFGLMLAFAVLLAAFVALWPESPGRSVAAAFLRALFGEGAGRDLELERRYVLIVLVVGALGGLVHGARSFGNYVGTQEFRARWIWWYLLRAPISAAVAVVFYTAVRGGILSSSSSAANLSLFGVAALAGMVGLFTDQALQKLEQAFVAVFVVAKTKEDALPPTKTTPPPSATKDGEKK